MQPVPIHNKGIVLVDKTKYQLGRLIYDRVSQGTDQHKLLVKDTKEVVVLRYGGWVARHCVKPRIFLLIVDDERASMLKAVEEVKSYMTNEDFITVLVNKGIRGTERRNHDLFGYRFRSCNVDIRNIFDVPSFMNLIMTQFEAGKTAFSGNPVWKPVKS